MIRSPSSYRTASQRALYLATVVGATVGLSWAMLWVDRRADARLGAGVHPVVIPGFKYEGNASCAGSKCHTADQATEQTGQLIGDENNIWDKGDPHNKAYESIEMDFVSVRRPGVSTAALAETSKIADKRQSAKCLDCHAVNAPEAQRGDKFRLQTGVGCEGCHGPEEKSREPHAKAGWTKGLRESIGAKGLLDEWGLVDTSHLAVRANTCVACHLQIDKDLVDAGHPPLRYDQYAYNTIKYK